MSRKPNYLFLVGAPKCGTSTVAHMLGGHPDVVVAKSKEPVFFTDFASRSWTGPGTDGLQAATVASRDAYEAEFAANPGASWRVDASTDYLSCPVSAERIAAFREDPSVGQVRVAVILRDPVARAISEYQHTVRDHFESGSLHDAILNEAQRLAAGMHPLFGHVQRGRYASQIARYRALFDDVLILDYHRLGQGFTVLHQLTDWMGLASMDALDRMASANASHVYRSAWIHRVIEHEAVKHIARVIVPQRFRDGVRQAINRLNHTTYSPSAVELDMLRAALKEEIDACVADPRIPTDHWRLALGHG